MRREYLKRFVLKHVKRDKHYHIPIYIQNGNKSPQLHGEPSYHVNESGRQIVWYPRAYERAGGRTQYVPTSEYIVVGYDWLLDQFVPETQLKINALFMECSLLQDKTGENMLNPDSRST